MPKIYYAQYPINRKLTSEERGRRLQQKRRLNITPFYNLSVASMNSTHLECVDRWFEYRGIVTTLALGVLGFTFYLLFAPILMSLPTHPFANGFYFKWVLLASPSLIFLGFFIRWMALQECFRWTYYPIRFNYRNRMVYVFKMDGSVLQAKWDDIFFTLGRCQIRAGTQYWDIRGHILDADGQTVRASFSLPGNSPWTNQLQHGWEFFRRYMEDGPASVYRDVYWCHDIATRRESYRAGLTTLFFLFNGLPVWQILFSPAFLLASLGRWFAMRTSKIPVWPADVEAQCKVDPFDPYLRDASKNPGKVPMEPLSLARNRDQ
jgi:hypothetical protein